MTEAATLPSPRAATPARHVLHLLGATFAIQGIGLVTGMLVARALGTEGRGQIAAIIGWAGAVVYIGDLGAPLAYVYEAARDRRQVPALLGNGIALLLAQWAVLTAVGLVVLPLALGRLGPGVARTGVIYLALFLPLNLGVRYLMGIQQGARSYGRFNLVRLSVPVAYAVALVAALALGGRSVGWVVVVTLLSNVAGLAVVLALTLPGALREFGRPRFDPSLLRRTLAYGLRAHIGNLTPIDSMQIDLLVVAALLGAADAGIYSVAVSAALVLRAQGMTLGLLALPEVAAAPTPEAKRIVAGRIFRVLLLMNLATAAAVVAVAGLVVPAIYGHDFSPAVPVVRILVLGTVAASLRQLLGDCLRGAGRPLTGTVAEVVSWVVAAASLAGLVPLLGTEGAALAVSLSYLSALAVSVGFARGLGLAPRDLFLPDRDDIGQALAVLRSARASLRVVPKGGS